MDAKIKVSAVSYTNTLPFVFGLQQAEIIDQIALSVDHPSECARKLIADEVDLGIVPVAALLQIPNSQIISSYCLGADGPVNSVFVFSEKPIHEVNTLRLDEQSRTSNLLAQVLFKYHWKKDIKVIPKGDADAFVQIGDRTFGQVDLHAYAYDLSEHWKNYTGLPFVFAVWVANKSLPTHFVDAFDSALGYGLAHRDEVIRQLPIIPNFDAALYLHKQIDYVFDADKKLALKEFLRLIENFH